MLHNEKIVHNNSWGMPVFQKNVTKFALSMKILI